MAAQEADGGGVGIVDRTSPLQSRIPSNCAAADAEADRARAKLVPPSVPGSRIAYGTYPGITALATSP